MNLFLLIMLLISPAPNATCHLVNGVELGQITEHERNDGWETLQCKDSKGSFLYSTDLHVFRGCTEIRAEVNKERLTFGAQAEGCEVILRPKCGADDEAGVKPGLMNVPCRGGRR